MITEQSDKKIRQLYPAAFPQDDRTTCMETGVDDGSSETFVMPSHLPKVIRGCMLIDGCDYDSPCVIYYPFFDYAYGGTTRVLDSMVDDACVKIANGQQDDYFKQKRKDFDRECQYQGWRMKGMKNRTKAHHVEFRLGWFRKANGALGFTITERIEQREPFRSFGR